MNWSGLKFPVAVNKISEFEKTMTFPFTYYEYKDGIYTSRESQSMMIERKSLSYC